MSRADQLADLHGDACARISVQALLHDVEQGCILDGVKGNAVVRVGDGMHLLNECQSAEGRVPIHHLVQDAAQAPDVRRPAHLQATRLI